MKNERGSSLYLTLLIMSVMLSVVLGLTNIIIGGSKLVGGLSSSVKAFTAADTGVEMALYQIYKGGNCTALSNYLPGESSTSGYGYSYAISGSCLSSGMVIDSTGTYLTSSRKIEISFGGSGSSVNASCGSNATPPHTVYAYNASAYDSSASTAFCATGDPSPEAGQISFPGQGSSTNWTCVALGQGSNSSCTASRNSPP